MAVAQRVNKLAKDLDELAGVLAQFRDRLGNAQKDISEITRSIQRMTIDLDNRAALQEAQRDRMVLLEARVISLEQREETTAAHVSNLQRSTDRLAQYVGAQDAVRPSVSWSEPVTTGGEQKIEVTVCCDDTCEDCECCP